MSEMPPQTTDQQMTSRQLRDDDTINLLDYLEAIAKRWKMIAIVTTAAFVISITISLLLPKIYSSTTMILPPQQDQGMMGMMSQMIGGDLSLLAGSMLGKSTPAEQYASILESDRIKGAIIDRFNLMKEYDVDYRLDMYKKMDDIVDVSVGKKDGIISITVEDKDPKKAADIANAYTDELEKVTVKLSSSGAGQNKIFLADRLAKAKVDLAKAEDALKLYQKKNKALDITEQAKATIEGVAQLKAQLAIQETQLASLRAYLTDDNDEVKTAKAAIANIIAQIASLEGNGNGSSIPSVGSVPALGEQYLRLMREFKIQETLVELLTKQYEMAKLSEANDVANVQVIQRAEVPDRKAKPKRSLIVLLSTFAAGFVAVLFAFMCDAGSRMSGEDRERLLRMRRMVLGDKPLLFWSKTKL
jgi:tyrosine-protein kinase Etk/Wzc